MGSRIDSSNKYDILRKKAEQSNRAQSQEASGAIQRKFAALGRSGSGAAIKNERDIQNQSAQNLQSANESIGFQEAAEKERNAQIEAERAFQRGEREASQKYASGESALARKFATQERLGGQQFASSEAKKARDLQSSQFKESMAASASQFAQQMALAGKQFDLDKLIAEANLRIQEKMANKKGFMDYLKGHVTLTQNITKGKFNAEDIIYGSSEKDGLSGSLVCTDYFENGWISEETFKATQQFSDKYVTRREKANYQAWAKGYLDSVSKFPILRHITWPIFSRCIYFMAGEKTFLGQLVYKLVFNYTTKQKHRQNEEVAHGN